MKTSLSIYEMLGAHNYIEFCKNCAQLVQDLLLGINPNIKVQDARDNLIHCYNDIKVIISTDKTLIPTTSYDNSLMWCVPNRNDVRLNSEFELSPDILFEEETFFQYSLIHKDELLVEWCLYNYIYNAHKSCNKIRSTRIDKELLFDIVLKYYV